MEVCPSSLAAYLDLHGFPVAQCQPQFKQHQLKNIKMPILIGDSDLGDLIEWVGVAALGVEWY